MFNSNHQFFNSTQSVGHSYFISKDEKLFSFGCNNWGQLSLGDKRNRNKPEEVKFKDFYRGKQVFVKKIAFGSFHSLILTKDFRVFGVGRNDFGQLSLGDEKNRSIPTLNNCFKKKKVLNVFGGGNHSIFIVENELFSSGNNFDGQLGIGNRICQSISQKMKFSEKIKDVKGASCFTLLLSVKNELFKTGIVDEEAKCVIPMKIIGLKKGEIVIKMSAGFKHFLVLSNSKRVYGFGYNGYNKMTSTFKPKSTKELELIPCLNGIIDIKVGIGHSIILDDNETAMGLGNSEYLGASNLEKDKNGIVFFKKNIIQIETGRRHTFLFDKNNDVWVGGYNEVGGLGLGHTKNKYENLQKNSLLKNIKIIHSITKVYSIIRNSFLNVIIVTKQSF